MPQTVAELLEAALALPEAERAELAELLAASVPSPPSSLHADWPAELRRRVAEIDSGQVRPVPWDEVRRQVQAQLDDGGVPNG
jgi:putative addiction module component (TIGR02574 family)